MFEEEMSVGPKGQVVIPVTLRKALKITPGSKVIFKLDGDRIIMKKPKTDSVNIFREIAKNGRNVNEIKYDEYTGEIFKRNKL
ncbi:AbrB/MazE/SpoVT family DNA-binding domain-containing protein [Picrophilus oshimae]|uniref:Looped-hinge helix DNA binding domain-containing protein, AbrB family n=1 Tax=Picrophilus torridus (strain ATCC 700027 / DSM 9790 / JCM 10055 / NBRC 100828 / KAW 2/3) TaxID=1122961 RepID=A0A8G2L7B0_PICTO|nr:AbrB/MazE/SpoVT family DNA-binding domain-containing protein [Picrophilus oshimae]SMD30790.1 looped-hinge helix DNA binding domain-containing protein, AbrB family [Picrophilus oshimae DSM 9789]